MEIRRARPDDAEQVARIYNHYILNTVVTFEVDEVSIDEMTGRMEKVWSASYPWLIAECDGSIAGFAYASHWHVRSAYRHSAETTVYLDSSFSGRGIGSALYRRLLEQLSETEVHTVIGGIALPNAASVALHEKFGFSKAAHYREVGFKFGRWIDVGYWQKIISDNSPAQATPT